ncbi:MAG: High-affnity carbon uptake protein Hat/HatR [Candidatus Angelobacter sp.]|nr:High-affnity carbon uptake protein Hat/HatR [Candidatus Angelobacter sp.]
MKFLPDQTVARLQTEIRTPDLAGTRYRTLRFLGQGGMGAVWLVEDSILRRPVALKILAAENSSVDLAARLIQEATVLARLEHPGIVPVHDAGTLPDGRTFYCMKHVEGKTLDRHIDGLLLRQRLLLFQRIAEPLAFAHSRGIIHRDLKPANIMVGAFGEVLIMDWGLAKVMNATSASSTTGQAPGHVMGGIGMFSPAKQMGAPPAKQVSGHEFTRAVEGSLESGALAPENALATTAHGTILGTPGYMAPEQERGELNLIDPRTDVFALGSILQYLLQSESSAPSPLRAICNKSMASEMSARYPSVQELAADVAKYLDGMPVSAYRENIFERTARLVSRNRVAVVLVLAYLFMRLLFILFSRR